MKEKKEDNINNAELIIISKGCVVSQPYNIWIVKGSCSNSIFLSSFSGSETFHLEDFIFSSLFSVLSNLHWVSLGWCCIRLDLNLVCRETCLIEVTEDMFTDVCERWNFASLLIWNHYLTFKSTKQTSGCIMHLWKIERKQTWIGEQTKSSTQ